LIIEKESDKIIKHASRNIYIAYVYASPPAAITIYRGLGEVDERGITKPAPARKKTAAP
jgi:hypothetical protein